MSSQTAGIGTAAVAFVVIVVLVVGAIAVVSLTSQSTTTAPISTSSPTSSSSASVSCFQTGIHGTLFVRVVSDVSAQPIVGANVTATILNYCVSGYDQPDALGLTNSSGYAPSWVGWTGNFTVSVTYAGVEYTLPAQTNGEVIVTLSVPSGLAVERTTACSGPPGCSLSTTTVTASTASSTAQSKVACPPNTTCGSITNAPAGPVHVDSVQATQSVCQSCGIVNGGSHVTFAVTFENTGSSPISFPDGSTGVAMSFPADSILQKVAAYQCQGISAIAKIDPGQNYTLYGPSCEAGYDYQLVQAGSVNITFSFNWTTNSTAANSFDFSNSTTISAQFVFA